MCSENNTRTLCGVTFSLKPCVDNNKKTNYYRITVMGSVSNSLSRDYSEEEFAEKGLALALILLNMDNNDVSLNSFNSGYIALTEDVFDLIPFEFAELPDTIQTIVEYFGEENTHYLPMLLDIPVEDQKRIITEYIEKNGEQTPEDVLNYIGLEPKE